MDIGSSRKQHLHYLHMAIIGRPAQRAIVLCMYICGSGIWATFKPLSETRGLALTLGVTLVIDAVFVKLLGFYRSGVINLLHSIGHFFIDGLGGSLLILQSVEGGGLGFI